MKDYQEEFGSIKWDLEYEKTLPEREFGPIKISKSGVKKWGEVLKGTNVKTGRRMDFNPESYFFEGYYIDGQRNGHGVYIWVDGERYQGEFKDNKMNGYGVYT